MYALIGALLSVLSANPTGAASLGGPCGGAETITAKGALLIAAGAVEIDRWPGIDVRVKLEDEEYWVSFSRRPTRHGSSFGVQIDLCGRVIKVFYGL